jgi:hypothetical protein
MMRTSTQLVDFTGDDDLASFKKFLTFVEGYIIPVLLATGILGNSLSFIVFIRTRRRAEAPVQYLSLLAVSDTGVILILGFSHWLTYGLPYITNGIVSYNPFTLSKFSCKFLAFVLHVSECTSAWMIATFSVERAFVVWYPLKRASITTKRRAIIIAVECSLAIIISVHRLWLMQTYVVEGIDACFYLTDTFWLWQYDTLMHNYLPCLMIVIANTIILTGIRRAKTSLTSKTHSTKTIQESKVLISLFVVSTLYVVFMIPASCSFTYFNFVLESRNYGSSSLNLIHVIVTFFDQFSMLNFCFNFVIYGCTLPFYREEIKKMFTSRCQRIFL